MKALASSTMPVTMKRILVLALALAVLPAARLAGRQDVSSRLFDAGALLRDLRTLSADDMEGRQIGTPGGAKARAFLIGRFKESGVQPFGDTYEQPFTYMAGRGTAQAERQGVNVVGRIDGTASPRRYLVISAHYDHVGARNGTVFNGADDNASGTAALLALASYFRAHRPANTLIFAAFDGEEAGLRGARAFVATPPVDLASIVVNLNVDMIGRDPNDLLYVVGTTAQPGLKPLIERIASKAPVKLVMGHDDPVKARENPRNQQFEDWTADSDHKAFCDAKIPCLYFGVEDFVQHHKATDDYETMTLPFYVRATETIVRAVEEFDARAEDVIKFNGAGKPKAPRP